ncbi:hypothetical protein [Candidatus Leptofilum sp.]|uniref:hypothetical protein n=1 Tax=Candidatus Leptofilum sp. TaxID=3241576 RepID=UPI003B5AEF39
MKKLILILSLLWLTACTGIEDGDAIPTVFFPTVEATPIPNTPIAENPATAVPPTETAMPQPVTAVPPTETPIPPPATPVPTEPPAQSGPMRIEFAPETTSATINGTLAAGQSIEYLAWAAAGQWATVEISSPNNVANFSMVGVKDGQPLKRLENERRFWDGSLPLAQDYLIRVHTLTEADYTLILTIDPLTDLLQPIYPIVDGMTGFLLGGSHNGEWVTDPFVVLKSLQDGERPYQLYANSTFQGTIIGQPPTTPFDGPCGGTPGVPFPPESDLSNMVALAVGWEAAPRQPQLLPLDTDIYQQAVAEFLQTQGIANPEVHLTSLQKIDLEGDGLDEVLITATHLTGLGNGLPTANAGDYSLVLLRKIVHGTLVTIPLEVRLFPEAVELADPVQYNVLGILDLNGDGTLEIVLEGSYYEGRFVTVYESVPQAVQAVLTAGCRL